jgi:hypothetical protein
MESLGTLCNLAKQSTLTVMLHHMDLQAMLKKWDFWISSLIRRLSLMVGTYQVTAAATVEVSQLTFCVS